MLVNTVRLASGEPVYVIDDFFPVEQIERLLAVTDRFTRDSEHWHVPPGFNHEFRYVYNGDEPEYLQVIDYATSPEFLGELSLLTGSPVWLSNHTMWVDFPGFGALKPHKEQGGEFLVQVFVTRQQDPLNGTTFYTEDRRVLLQLPFRNNLAWLFEGTRVMHGRQQDVAPGLSRFIIMLWYNRRVVQR